MKKKQSPQYYATSQQQPVSQYVCFLYSHMVEYEHKGVTLGWNTQIKRDCDYERQRRIPFFFLCLRLPIVKGVQRLKAWKGKNNKKKTRPVEPTL